MKMTLEELSGWPKTVRRERLSNLVKCFSQAMGGDQSVPDLVESLRSVNLGAETLRVLLDGANTRLTNGHRSRVFLDDYLPAIEQVV